MKLAKLLRCSQNETDEKITDKSLNRSIAVSVVGILFCMTCLFGMTWALFVDSVVTLPNTFASASYDLIVTVTDTSTGNTVDKGEDGYYTLDPAKIYTVILDKAGTASAGFCHISVVAQTPETVFEYYTGSIPRADGTTMQPSDQYELSLSGISKVAFTPMWGQPSDAALAVTVQHNGVLSFDVSSVAATNENGDEPTQNDVTSDQPEATENDPSESGEVPTEQPTSEADAPITTEPQPTEATENDPSESGEVPTEQPTSEVDAQITTEPQPTEATENDPSESGEAPTEQPTSEADAPITTEPQPTGTT